VAPGGLGVTQGIPTQAGRTMDRSVRSFVAALVLTGTIACSGGTVEPTGPQEREGSGGAPLSGRIIFTSISPDSYYTRGGAVWTALPDGSDPQVLVGRLQWPGSPSVAPDGEQVVFEDANALFIIPASGGTPIQLALPSGMNAWKPKWSPDSDWILFTGGVSGGVRTDLYRIRSDGTGLQTLTSGGPSAWSGNWSPDGQQVAYTRDLYDPVTNRSSQGVVIRDLSTGTDTVLIAPGTGFFGQDPSWSPDGAFLYFLDVQGGDWVIGRLEIATLDYQNLGSARGNRPPTLSPDGTTLLFGTGKLWTSAPDGSGAQVIVNNGRENFDAYWTPAAP